MRAVIDLDYIKYAAASAGEKRTIKVIHKASGREIECKTRTEFWGHWQKRDGGILAEINKKSKKEFAPEEFDIIDVQTPEPVANVLHTAKVMTESIIAKTKADDYVAYLGRGDSFRVERSTILKYKGNRTDMLKPLLLDDVTEYLHKKFKAKYVEGIENDDQVVTDCYGKKDHFIVGVDKDFYGAGCLFFNARNEEGIVDCSGLGSLRLNEKGEVKGKGRMFLYWQICSGDSSDNYFANSACDIPWADKSAYNALVDCKSDAQALKTLVRVYKHLYPEPKTITGWRGDEILIDWEYVANENFDMARMLRWEDDKVVLSEVLDKFGVRQEGFV